MNTIELTNDKYTKADFARMKSMLGCASKDSTRHVITKVLVETQEEGITITATDGRRMRSDHFGIEAEAGIYDIKVNSGKLIMLTKCSEDLVFPSYRQVIPNSEPENAYALHGTGKRFVLWATSALGCYLDSKLVEVGANEIVTLYINKSDPRRYPALLVNDVTTMVVMPYSDDGRWIREVEAIQQERIAKAIEQREQQAKAEAIAA
jgi:hypothetical protein